MVWILRGKSPDEIPMARLAEYMSHLAAMLGETDNVHFARVEEGSTKLVAHVDAGRPAQRVQARAYAVREHRAPREAMSAYNAINDMLSADRGTARLTHGSATVIRFPGAHVRPAQTVSLLDSGTITGQLYALSEDRAGEIKARIRPRTGTAVICTADRSAGLMLRKFLFEPVRVHGQGKWERDVDGGWSCQSLHIRDVRQVRDSSVRDAIAALRTINVEWPDDPLDDLDERDGAA